LDQSIGIDKTNTFQLKFCIYHENCGRHRLGRFLGVRVGEALIIRTNKILKYVGARRIRAFRGVRVGVAPCMPSPNILTFMVSEISAFIRTDGHGKIHSPSDPDEEYVYYMGSEALPSIFSYFLSDESSIPFYSTSNGYSFRRI